MRQLLASVLVAVLAFAVGLLAGSWAEKHRPIPAPPGVMGGEFFGHRPAFGGGFRHEHGPSRAELLRQVEALRPQIDAFKKTTDEIDAEFNRAFDALLNPEQRARHADHLKRMQDMRNRHGSPSGTNLLYALNDESAHTILWDVVVPLRLDSLTDIYALDAGQREKVRTLLLERRQKEIALIDSAPPPSVMLWRLAPWMQRMARPDGPPPPAR